MQTQWQPHCHIHALKLRASVLAHIRQFFAERAVLEVETPLLSQTIGTDPQLAFFNTTYEALPLTQTLFLQTSPEFAMKRLLAAGCGSIYQICKAFRNGESGRFHNPEFTLLEWYRVGFDLSHLMDEVQTLLIGLFANYRPVQSCQRYDYADLFQQVTGLSALHFSYADYCQYAHRQQLSEAIAICQQNHALWLDFIFSHCIQPMLAKTDLVMVHGYPACQSSLARCKSDNPAVTERVEVFIHGVECGNGFYELTDAQEQAQRFANESAYRQQVGLAKVMPDQRLLSALQAGLPDCSGIALGIDRLLMCLSQANTIEEVLSFAISRA